MKAGMSLQDLAREIDRQAESKQDFVTSTEDLTLLTPRLGDEENIGGGGPPELHLPEGHGEFPLTEHAQRQLADRIGIPFKLWDRFRSAHPDLLDHNVNTLFRREPARRMVRTLDGQARAFLSDRYRRLDYQELSHAVFPILAGIPDVQIASAQITEQRMYIKAVAPRVQAEVKKGDVVQAGVVISNSEVGSGALKVQPLIYRLVCLNGMIAGTALSRYHIGKQVDSDEALRAFRDETLQADDRAFFLKIADVVKAAVDETAFALIVASMEDAAASQTVARPERGLEVLAKKIGLGEEERQGVLRHLIEGGDLSNWGFLNAVTRFSQDVDSYDRATELEEAGGRVLAMAGTREWTEVATAR